MTKSASQSGWRSGFVTAATWLALSALVWTWTGPAAAWAPGDDTPATAERAAEQDNPTDASAPTNGSASTDGTAPTNGSDPTDGSANAATGSQGASKPKGNSGRVLSIVALVAAIFIIPMLLGNFLSKKLRMPDHGTRISIVLFAIIASVAATLGGWPPKLGIDLGGGAILVYEVKDKSFKEMDKLVGAVLKRVNPDGLKEVNVRPYGEHEIEIIIPMADEAELARMQNIISQQGTLEFRIVADAQFREDEEIINLAKDDQFKDEKDVIDADKDGATTVVARWVPVVPDEVGSIVSQRGHPVRENKKGETEVLVLIDKQNVTGEFLTSATAGNDENAQPCVHFRFNPAGAKRFGRLTSNNLPNPIDEKQAHKLAIILDGRLHSAPFIRSRIDELGQITGRFTAEEVGRLADVLTAGSLPTTLREEPTSSMHIGATLGEDTKTKGVWSMIWSTVAVVIFMVFYYRFAGIVANLALLLNVLLIVAFMILFNAAFTLSGLAGLALTVGMAVDANVLIYERMREEISRGATLRMAIRNGFERATTTIVDANVTTLISAVVLWFIGTDQVKGFAVTLILGIVMNLFTAITFTRLIFDIAEKHRWIKQLKMLRVMEKPNFDFIGKRKLAISFSLLLIGAGLVGVFLRGRGLLDIDFTGGVSVQVLFEKKQEIGYIRDRVNDLPDVTVQSVDLGDEEKGHRFLIVTSMSEIDESNPPPSGPKTNITLVERTLKDVFNDADHRLAFNHLTWSGLAPHGGLKPATEAKPPDDANPPEADGADAGRAGGVSPLLAAALDPDADAGRAGDVSPLLVAAGSNQDDAATIDESPLEKTKPANQAGSPATKKAGAKRDLYAGGTVVTLTFADGDPDDATTKPTQVNHDTLSGEIKRALVAGGFSENVAFKLDNPEYEAGSDKRFAQWTLTIGLTGEPTESLLKEIKRKLAQEPFFPSSNRVGASVAFNTQAQATFALLASLVMIVLYVWIRFQQVSFGFAAVLALVHDVLVALGALALSYWLANLPFMDKLLIEPFKINLPIIAAFLTIIGYSINDTIVIFDRIREIRGKSPELGPDLVNRCVNETLSRTLLTSLTVFIVVLILYIFGGLGIHGFAFTLVIGTISGTYSTVYIATPVLIWMNKSKVRGGGAAGGSMAKPKPPVPSATGS
ncbi:MAG TPA: protein translocase subunit SecD [Pirellulales bacterium]|nr:protein translocase subunit SecD [Pirellulales bacterium]